MSASMDEQRAGVENTNAIRGLEGAQAAQASNGVARGGNIKWQSGTG